MKFLNEINLGGRLVGRDHPVMIVAELSANHNQSFEVAVQTLKAAKAAGADAVKLQTYTADTITAPFRNPHFLVEQPGSLWEGEYLYDLYQRAYTPWEWHQPLQKLATELGLIFFSTPFDATAIRFLEDLDVPAYKIGSPEITDLPLIREIAATGKPVILSSGIARLADLEAALQVCAEEKNQQVILLKCTSAYPTPVQEVNLRAMQNFATAFGVLVGLSDHTLGHTAPSAAVALGAVMIEKHLILAAETGGPDAGFSTDQAAFAEMVKVIRETEQVLGDGSFELSPGACASRRYARSLFVVEDIAAGEAFSPQNVRSIRPGAGLAPVEWPRIEGRRARVAIQAGTPLDWTLVEP